MPKLERQFAFHNAWQLLYSLTSELSAFPDSCMQDSVHFDNLPYKEFVEHRCNYRNYSNSVYA